MRKGVHVTILGKPGWTVSEDSVEAGMEEILVEDKIKHILILQCVNESMFYVQ